MSKKPFEPLNIEEKTENQNQKEEVDYGVAITPIPKEVKLQVPKHPLGKPAAKSIYYDAKGNSLFYVMRFIDKNGKKADRPLTYREYKDETKKWAWKGLNSPRPIYGLDRLAKNPDAPVIICEGEKATNAAIRLFPDYVAVTSPNGAGSPHKADWSPLKGRDVTIWPDNDDEGRKYAEKVDRLLKEVKVKSVAIVDVPNTFPSKWDLADELPDGKDLEILAMLLSEAKPIAGPLDNLIERINVDGIGLAYASEVIDALILITYI